VWPDAPGAGRVSLPAASEALLPLGPLAVALAPGPEELVAVLPSPLCVVADEPPVPTVDAETPLPAVALPPLPTVLELPALPPPEPLASPPLDVVVVLCALRTPVPPSAWRPAAIALLSVVPVALVPAVCAYVNADALSAIAPAINLYVNVFIVYFSIFPFCFLGIGSRAGSCLCGASVMTQSSPCLVPADAELPCVCPELPAVAVEELTTPLWE
jgi:hypothetical protein